jgi:hypothetical protein
MKIKPLSLLGLSVLFVSCASINPKNQRGWDIDYSLTIEGRTLQRYRMGWLDSSTNIIKYKFYYYILENDRILSEGTSDTGILKQMASYEFGPLCASRKFEATDIFGVSLGSHIRNYLNASIIGYEKDKKNKYSFIDQFPGWDSNTAWTDIDGNITRLVLVKHFTDSQIRSDFFYTARDHLAAKYFTVIPIEQIRSRMSLEVGLKSIDYSIPVQKTILLQGVPSSEVYWETFLRYYFRKMTGYICPFPDYSDFQYFLSKTIQSIELLTLDSSSSVFLAYSTYSDNSRPDMNDFTKTLGGI